MATPFDSSTITRFQNNAEDDFATSKPCIKSRASIALVAGTAVYNLPDYCISIARVTYLGWQVYPLPHRELRLSYVSGNQQSRPYWYIFNNIGLSQIRLFPVPSLSVPQVVGDLWQPTQIIQGLVIEFYRMPNYTTEIIPPFYRSKILGNYQLYRSYAMEGQYQDMKGSKYHYNKWLKHKAQATDLLDDLHNKPRNLIASGVSQRPYGFLPPPPLLPVSANSPSQGTLIWQGIPIDDVTG